MTDREKQNLRIMLDEQRRIWARRNSERRIADPKHKPEIEIHFPLKKGEK
jgi:hypothetical protein